MNKKKKNKTQDDFSVFGTANENSKRKQKKWKIDFIGKDSGKTDIHSKI